MAITKIEFGSIADPEVINNNFEYLDEKLTDTSSKIYTNNSSLESMVSSQISTLLLQVTSKIEALYPVGSVYIGTTNTCPVANLFGTWEKVAGGLVIDINSNVAIKGNGKSLGLKAESDTFGLASSSSGDIGKLLGLNASARNINAGTEVSRQTLPRTFNAVGVTTNASQSGLVGTASATKLTVNIWKRVA